jgi:hypothetical protein
MKRKWLVFAAITVSLLVVGRLVGGLRAVHFRKPVVISPLGETPIQKDSKSPITNLGGPGWF